MEIMSDSNGNGKYSCPPGLFTALKTPFISNYTIQYFKNREI
jgi:hypothetical protein